MNNKPSIIPFIIRELADSSFGFFYDWYIKAPKAYWEKTKGSFKSWERQWALVITIKNWLTPLYQDYTPVGYIMGVIVRTGRIFLGIVFYIFFFAIALFLIFLWLILPFYMVWMVFASLV